jgi:hypothetical protein
MERRPRIRAHREDPEVSRYEPSSSPRSASTTTARCRMAKRLIDEAKAPAPMPPSSSYSRARSCGAMTGSSTSSCATPTWRSWPSIARSRHRVHVYALRRGRAAVPQALLKRIKIASGCITRKPLARGGGDTGLPVILSTGMSTMDDVTNSADGVLGRNVTLLHCTSAYPCRLEDVNLRAMDDCARNYGCRSASPTIRTA